MSDRDFAPGRAYARLFVPVLALVAAGIIVIVLAGSLGAATSGRSLWSQWFGPAVAMTHGGGQTSDTPTRTSEFRKRLERSGA